MKKKYYLLLFLVISMLLLLLIISKNSFELVAYNNTQVKRINPDNVKQDQYIEIIKSRDNLDIINKEFNFPKEALELYTEDFFKTQDLVVIALKSKSTPKYTIPKILKRKDILIVNIERMAVKGEEEGLVATSMFVEVEKHKLDMIKNKKISFKTTYSSR